MKFLLSVLFSLIILQNFCQAQNLTNEYLGQPQPEYIPQIFHLSLSAGKIATERIAVSKDGTELYYCELNGYPWNIAAIKQYKYSEEKWAGPFTLFTGYIAPALSPGEDTLYFEDNQQYTWYSLRADSTWSTPVKFPGNNKQHYSQLVNSGNYYFTSTPVISSLGDLYKTTKGNDTIPWNLGVPVNSANNGMDYYISNDESYIIRVIRNNGIGDLFISFHKPDGNWTNPKNLGPQVNSSQSGEWGPYVTPDSEFLFFSRGSQVYWVKIHNLIDSLKETNYSPYVKSKISSQNITIGVPFTLQVPDTIFIDDDGNETLTYSAVLSNGNQLPAWMQFDPVIKIFSGTPDNIIKDYNINLNVSDGKSGTAACTFKISVKELSIDYLGQTPPGSKAMAFNTGGIQANRNECAGVFSRDGKEFYFSSVSSDYRTRKTYFKKFENGSWTDEVLASFTLGTGGSTETFITKDNNHIIFPSSENATTSDGWLKTDFWITERSTRGWNAPRKLGAAINNIEVQWHPTISDSGHIYFGSRGAVYIADHINDTTFGIPVKLNDVTINKPNYANADPFIAPDEQYLIFSSNRPGGSGNNDLYISYKNADHSWTEAINLGANVNSSENESSSYVTPDGRYLLFARSNNNNTVCRLYWVSTSFIDSIENLLTDIDDNKSSKISTYHLSQNYPNPFNPVTNIEYSLPGDEFVELKVYDILGKEISTLINDIQQAGRHQVQFDGSHLASGIYLYKIKAGTFTDSQKLILLK